MPELKRHHTNRVVGGAFTARSRQSGRGGAMYPRRRAPCRGAEDHKLAAEAAPTGNELALVGAASAASASRRSCFHEDAAALAGTAMARNSWRHRPARTPQPAFGSGSAAAVCGTCQPQACPSFCCLSHSCSGAKYSSTAAPSICSLPVSSFIVACHGWLAPLSSIAQNFCPATLLP